MSTKLLATVPVKCHACKSLYYTKTPESGCEQCGSHSLQKITHSEATALFNEAIATTMFTLKE
jgi:Zn finger protein HypA/HybF involved in hydrogenase expression